jgi:hypothetical protein
MAADKGATMAEKPLRRSDIPPDAEHRAIGTPEEEVPANRLLAEYEDMLGPLRRKEEGTPGGWPWSWSVEQVLIFVSEWDRPIYILNATLRDVAFTKVPGSQRTVVQSAAAPGLRDSIERIVGERGLSVGPATKFPAGNCEIDLRTFRAEGP